MPPRSAGLLLFRRRNEKIQVLLVHPGGPYWKNKDVEAWSIPKGLVEGSEDELVAACRETQEELGIEVTGKFEPLGHYRQPGGKIVLAWWLEYDIDTDDVRPFSRQGRVDYRDSRSETCNTTSDVRMC